MTSAAGIAVRPLGRLLEPRAIAVVGASTTPGKAGNALTRNLGSFAGPVWAVNPKGESVAGRPGAQRIGDIPDPVDLALLAVPAPAVLGVVRECARAGVGAVVVHSGGWGETGEDGAALQAAVVDAAREAGIRVLGPNTSGFFDPARRLCASFVAAAAELPAGSLAVVAQSGGVNHALAFQAAGEGLGIRLGIGLGNASDVGFADVLEYLEADGSVEVVALAVEGVADGRRLVEAVERLAEAMPVVALKTGRTDIEAFARSHTGALTGSWRVTRAALAQAGAVVVDDLTQLVDAAQALRAVRLPAGLAPGVGVVTGQAGPGLLLADELGAHRVRMPELPTATRERIGELLPPLTYQRNPVDTGRPAESFGAVLEAVGSAQGIDLTAVYLLDEPDAVDPASLFRADGPPSVLALSASPERLAGARGELADVGVPVLPTPERAARAVAAVTRDARQRAVRATGASGPSPPPALVREAWDEDAAKDLVSALGIATPPRVVCTSHTEARQALARLGTPVVVKALHPGLEHKTEAGGVHLGVGDDDALERALAAIDRIEGARYLVETTAPAGPELILGARRDAVFGPIVALGAGGTAAEALDDVSVRLAPLGHAEAATMLAELASASAFLGARGAPAVDEDELAAAIVAFGDLIAGRDDIAEIEVNPLRVTPGGLVALDALVVAR